MTREDEDQRYRDYEDEDTNLMSRARDGDSSTFAQLYRKHLSLVLAYLQTLHDRVDAPDDIAQEVFMRLWAQRYQYKGQATFKTYLFAYVHKVCLEERRLHARRRALASHSVQGSAHVARPSEAPEVAVSRTETNESLHRALMRLTAEQREALRLFHLEGMSLQEAAARAGCTQECLESRLARGRDRLRRLLRLSERNLGDDRAPGRKSPKTEK
jgi:RNA polymerase sigma-70 factor (ECF subfamily)